MKKYSKQALWCQRTSVMETGDHFKNGASPKSLMSRGNTKAATSSFFGLIAVLAVVWLMASCGGGGGNTPSGIAKAFYTHAKAGNYEKACRAAIPKDACTAEMEKDMPYEDGIKLISGLLKYGIEAEGGVKSFSVGEENISEDGKTATVTVTVITGNGEENEMPHSFAKENGKWRMLME
jgi:hypothetical protein